ncbi:hypothetical protein AVO45_04220 [Ruegeria marisrubri]|uniref:Aminoglycoside phosphotransferase domain-containing protein n=2 Tax=Ruegeria marisrubri TaxID=1685379 RepID=A0A101CZH2_9RHOB|nr:hypothetical protein AVO45_04220 [Ruegeria marisrubri]
MPETHEGATNPASAIGFLSDPATHGGTPVERVDTHISHIFLTSKEAYKLKKPIKTNFLDFSTLEKREAACRRELEVNRAVAEEIYLDVVPITRRDGGLHLGGSGDIVDWVVRMRRFDRTKEFDRLAERGALDVPLAEALADVVARMHRDAPVTPEYGGAKRVAATIRQITEAISTSPAAARLKNDLDAWASEAMPTLSRRAPQLDSRRRHGYVRRCHGDLHLGNICLVKGRPTPFDAIEFNEEMASTDVIYDIAFVVMDMLERGLREQANAFLSRYLAATRDYSGLSLLPLFLSMRAAVRALVAASRDTPDSHEPDARERLAFALDCLRRRTTPRVIAMGGLSGSGKSTVARLVAPRIDTGLGAVVLRSDVARKHLFGVPPEQKLPDEAYRPETSARVYNRLLRDAGHTLRHGFPVLLDATFLSPEERKNVRLLAKRNCVPFSGIWLECDPDLLRTRVRNREGDVSDAGVRVLDKQLALHVSPDDWIHVSSEISPDETASRVLSALNHSAG